LLAGIPDPIQDERALAPPAESAGAPQNYVVEGKTAKVMDSVALGALALDIAQGYNDPEAIAEAYELDPTTFARLLQSPTFQRELSAARNAVQTEGGLAEFRLRCRMAAEQLLPKITSRANLLGANLSEIVSAFKAVSEMADLKPKEAKAEGSGGVTINFQLPNMPGLPNAISVSTGAPQPAPIDVTPTQPAQDSPAYGFDFSNLPPSYEQRNPIQAAGA
jgi:hypothetical protein